MLVKILVSSFGFLYALSYLCYFLCYIIQVDSTNEHGILLEVVRVLTDLNLTIYKAYISSDGCWFMDGNIFVTFPPSFFFGRIFHNLCP